MKNILKSFVMVMVVSLFLSSVNLRGFAISIDNIGGSQFIAPEDAIFSNNQVIVVLDNYSGFR